MLEVIRNPWPWWVSGPLIGLMVPSLLLFAGKPLGISGSFRYLCSLPGSSRKEAAATGNPARGEAWKAVFALGVLVGGFVAVRFLSTGVPALFPESFHSLAGAAQLLLGGFLVGFGSRYAEGCTSGHAIFGLATLQPGSLVAVLGFFAGGLGAAGLTLLFR